MAFERHDTPKTASATSSIVLLDRSASDASWVEVEEFPDTPAGQREAERTMYAKESTTGYSYRIVRRVTREEILINWE